MNSKALGGLWRLAGVTLLAGGFVAASAGVACAAFIERDSNAASVVERQPIKAPDRGPAGPVTISGALAGNDGAATVTTDGTTVVVSGRAHLESPVDHAPGGVVHHDERRSPLDGRGLDLGTDQVGFAGGATGDTSSVDVVGTGRVGAEKHYYVR